MQNATKLNLELLKDKCFERLYREWDKARETEARRGFSLPSGSLFAAIQDIGTKNIEEFIDELLKVEEDALQNTQALLSAEYFDQLADELIAEAEPIFKGITAQMRDGLEALPDAIRNAQTDRYETEKKRIVAQSITKTKILQDKYQRMLKGAVQTTPKDVESNFAKNKAIFLAHIFAEEELIGTLKKIIIDGGYSWEEGKREDLGSISEDILTKIKKCGFFVAVMTKKDKLDGKDEFTTSSWLIEEKGAALAFGHHPLIMVEEGVERHYVGFLQSDDEMIFFNRKDHESKMQAAVRKIDKTFQKLASI